ncbi:MAG: beta keto-acyl synthase, partial [Deltaproteobacteria bacterium]
VAMALHHKVLPATIKVQRPADKLNIEHSPFYLNTETRPWIRDADHPRRASVSSFGFGGTNFHLTVEEHDGSREQTPRLRSATTELVLLSGPNRSALSEACEQMADQAGQPGTLAHVARESQMAVDARAGARLALIASNEEDLRRKLAEARQAIEKAGDGGSFALPNGTAFSAADPSNEAIALLFSGQGSQYLGMGAAVALAFDEARAVWDRETHQPISPEARLHQVVFPRPVFTDQARADQARRLTATEWAQPAIGAVSASLLALLRKVGLQPACVAGHSFGEVTALHAAGVLDEQALLQIARQRGELMAQAAQQAAEPGGMMAVVARRDTVEPLLTPWPDVVVANHNAPEQVVLSGPNRALEEVQESLAAAGIKVRRLDVATAFHSPLVSRSAEPFGEYLKGLPFAAPRCPVYGNATARPYPTEAGAMRALLAEGIAKPVRFVEQIEAMVAFGVGTFVEVGPGSVLTELVGRCLNGQPHLAVSLDRKGQPGLTSLWRALGALVVAGHSLDLAPLWADDRLPPDPRKRKQPALTVPLDGANVGKAYPPAGGAAALPKPNLDKPSEPKPTSAGTAGLAATPKAQSPVAGPPSPPPAPSARPTPPTPAPVAGPTGSALPAPQGQPQGSWVTAYQEIQRQTAEAHAAYQRSTAESHLAFLKAAEASSMALAALATGQALPELPSTALHRPATDPPVTAPPVPAPSWPEPAVQPSAPFVAAPPITESPPEAVGETRPVASPAAVAPVVQPVQSAAPLPPADDLATVDMEQLLLKVVADKTGYPEEILELEMALEADLGIDSIKRVEILSAIKDQAPAMPEVDASEMAQLQTLGQVLAYMERFVEGFEQQPAEPSVQLQVADPGQVSAATFRRYAPVLVSQPPCGFCMPGLLTQTSLALVDDGGGVAPALAALLQERGVGAQVVSEVPATAGSVIFLAGLGSQGDRQAAMAVNQEAFAAAKQVAAQLSETGGLWVTVTDLGGDFGFSGGAGDRAWTGGLSGLSKTAALEWPLASVKAIDLERAGRTAEQLATVLLQELLAGGPEVEVALSADGNRSVVHTVTAPTSPGSATAMAQGSVIVVSGGARGVTPSALVELAKRHAPKLALLGRTPMVDEDASTRHATDDASLK